MVNIANRSDAFQRHIAFAKRIARKYAVSPGVRYMRFPSLVFKRQKARHFTLFRIRQASPATHESGRGQKSGVRWQNTLSRNPRCFCLNIISNRYLFSPLATKPQYCHPERSEGSFLPVIAYITQERFFAQLRMTGGLNRYMQKRRPEQLGFIAGVLQLRRVGPPLSSAPPLHRGGWGWSEPLYSHPVDGWSEPLNSSLVKGWHGAEGWSLPNLAGKKKPQTRAIPGLTRDPPEGTLLGALRIDSEPSAEQVWPTATAMPFQPVWGGVAERFNVAVLPLRRYERSERPCMHYVCKYGSKRSFALLRMTIMGVGGGGAGQIRFNKASGKTSHKIARLDKRFNLNFEQKELPWANRLFYGLFHHCGAEGWSLPNYTNRKKQQLRAIPGLTRDPQVAALRRGVRANSQDTAEPSPRVQASFPRTTEPSPCVHDPPGTAQRGRVRANSQDTVEPSPRVQASFPHTIEPSPCVLAGLTRYPPGAALRRGVRANSQDTAEPSPCVHDPPGAALRRGVRANSPDTVEPSPRVQASFPHTIEPSPCVHGRVRANSQDTVEPSPCVRANSPGTAEPSPCVRASSSHTAEPSPCVRASPCVHIDANDIRRLADIIYEEVDRKMKREMERRGEF